MDGAGKLFEPFVAALGGEFQVKVVRYPNAEALGYLFNKKTCGLLLSAKYGVIRYVDIECDDCWVM
jgi:hypothetical protein